MWALDHKEGWVLKDWCFWTLVLEKTLMSSLDCKEIKVVNPKGNQSWILIRTDAEAETPILWPSDVKNWLIGKDPDAGKDWRKEEKVATEDEMVGWPHWFNGHEYAHSCKFPYPFRFFSWDQDLTFLQRDNPSFLLVDLPLTSESIWARVGL